MYEWARGLTRVAVLTGAGISTDSGIPDYRGPQGVWTKDPSAAAVVTLPNYMRDTEVRQRFWATYNGHPSWQAEPNAAHKALADLDSPGLAVRVLTQNIDGLHQKAGLAARKVLELHGNMHSTTCVQCKQTVPTQDVLARVSAGEADPSCQQCGGILRVDIIMFGQNLDTTVFAKAAAIAEASLLFLAIGSSLEVYPVAGLCPTAVQAGAKLVIVNRDPTPYDDIATEVIREPIGTAVPKICEAIAQGR